MEKSWFQKLFSRADKTDAEVSSGSTDYENAEVQFGMGLKFAGREGAGRDYLQAAEWYRKAADQNHSLAQLNLGTMYAKGQGVAQDDAQSAMWFVKAAKQGDAGAQFHLGTKCHRDSFKGAPADAPESRIEAYKWYRLSAEQGYQGSNTAFTTLILNMSREDVGVGNERFIAFATENGLKENV
jgi:TPR repeat protein